MGRHIRNLNRGHIFERSEPVTESGCWLWTGRMTAGGYGTMSIRGKATRAHRVAFEAFIGPIPEGAVVMHSCDVPSCVNPAHLTASSQLENNRDKVAKGRVRGGSLKGAAHPSARLDDSKVRLILTSDRGGSDLARELGVSRYLVSAVRRRKVWRHVEVIHRGNGDQNGCV